MESLEDILKREYPLRTILKESTVISSDDESEEPPCPRCNGSKFIYADVPSGHPSFGRAIPCNCTKIKFEDNRFDRLKRYSNLGPLTRLTFDNLIPHGRSGDPMNQERFKRACQGAKVFSGNAQGWLVLTGPSGCGKTHLAAAIANECINCGQPVFFVVAPDFLDHLRATFSPNTDVTYDELFEQVRNTPLLIMDDLGTQSSTHWATEKMFQIFNHRYNAQLPTVVTTNLTMEAIEERLRMRLTDPSLSQVYLVEERDTPIGEQLGGVVEGLLSQMTFEEFDYKRVDLPLEQRENLERAFWLAHGFADNPDGWIVFAGTNGCGKTHLAAAIRNYRRQQSKPADFVNVPDFLDYLRSGFRPGSDTRYDDLFERVKATSLLILDDYGEHSDTAWAQGKLYQLINFRYMSRLPTVVTTCLTLEQIETRISSRLADPRLSVVFTIMAPDHRTDRQTVEVEKRSRPSSNRGRKNTQAHTTK